MKFPVVFTRWKGAGGKALGGDRPLAIGRNLALDNTIAARSVSINGWPLSRIVLAGNCPGGAVSTALPVACYVFEDTLGIWIPLPQSASTLTVGTTTAPSAPVFFDAMSMQDANDTAQGGAAGPGNGLFMVVVDDNATGVGRYDFALAAELTTKPF